MLHHILGSLIYLRNKVEDEIDKTPSAENLMALNEIKFLLETAMNVAKSKTIGLENDDPGDSQESVDNQPNKYNECNDNFEVYNDNCR